MACNTTLVFQLYTAREALPVAGARVTLYDPETRAARTLTTDASGKTVPVCLEAPQKALSLSPDSSELPYRVYDARISAPGYCPVTVEDIQIFAQTEALEKIALCPIPEANERVCSEEVIAIPQNTLREKPNQFPEGFEGDMMILREVTVPEYITVHLGAPEDGAAKDVSVNFADYIKNVASGSLYPTWPENALRANILAEISFALNRVFTEWYPGQGYRFDLTSSAEYDQPYTYGRNIYGNISRIVDEIFREYIRQPNVTSPYFALSCNGLNEDCTGMSQWGTVMLAKSGYTPLNILRNAYGNEIELVNAGARLEVPEEYPGTPLKAGMTSGTVGTMKMQLARVRRNYPAIPAFDATDNRFSAATQTAVRTFQRVFSLTPDGVVDEATWNRLGMVYSAVLRLENLAAIALPLPDERPAKPLRLGDNGEPVKLLQYLLSVVGTYCEWLRPVTVDGIFGPETERELTAFQRYAALPADGVVSPAAWEALYKAFFAVAAASGLMVPYPGKALREGDKGDNVRLMQTDLRALAAVYPLPLIEADGIFGPLTAEAVRAFQRLFGLTPDGVIGPATWERITLTRQMLR